MQITFDPHNAQERATIARFLDTVATWTHESADPTNDQVSAIVADLADKVFETAQPDAGDIAVATAPEHPAGETDCHGMVHDDAIHSTPPSFNADGSYRAKRGAKEAYDIAVAFFTAPPQAAPTPTPAPQGMPMPQPASAAPATPPAPIDYKTMAQRFMGKMADPDGLPAEYEAIYSALSIGYDDLETNQTSIDRLSSYMDAVDNGEDHDGCVRHALSA
jgi:hypothetical protein